MPKIVIKNLNNTVILTNDTSKPVLTHLHEHFIDWMHACGKKGRCTTCKMIVEEGLENLTDVTAHEKRFKDLSALRANERLACQAIQKKGDLIIRVPETSKLPHLQYSD